MEKEKKAKGTKQKIPYKTTAKIKFMWKGIFSHLRRRKCTAASRSLCVKLLPPKFPVFLYKRMTKYSEVHKSPSRKKSSG